MRRGKHRPVFPAINCCHNLHHSVAITLNQCVRDIRWSRSHLAYEHHTVYVCASSYWLWWMNVLLQNSVCPCDCCDWCNCWFLLMCVCVFSIAELLILAFMLLLCISSCNEDIVCMCVRWRLHTPLDPLKISSFLFFLLFFHPSFISFLSSLLFQLAVSFFFFSSEIINPVSFQSYFL